jgi:hypothetical protein
MDSQWKGRRLTHGKVFRFVREQVDFDSKLSQSALQSADAPERSVNFLAPFEGRYVLPYRLNTVPAKVRVPLSSSLFEGARNVATLRLLTAHRVSIVILLIPWLKLAGRSERTCGLADHKLTTMLIPIATASGSLLLPFGCTTYWTSGCTSNPGLIVQP